MVSGWGFVIRKGIEYFLDDVSERLDHTYLNPKTLDRFSSYLREVVCYNQGATSQYIFLASEFHRKLKDVVLTVNETESRDIPDIKLRQIYERKMALDDFLLTWMLSAFDKNITFLNQYFNLDVRSRVSAEPPRICVKTNFPPAGHKGESLPANSEMIITLARSSKVFYSSEATLHDNTGFKSIKGGGKTKDGGKYYISNNIPLATKGGKYTNPRLRSNAGDVYKLPSKWQSFCSFFTKCSIDEEWVHCWEGGESDKSSCYKSTLIVPMTLRGTPHMDKNFIRLFNTQEFDMENVERLIFGYLCFDHFGTNFFHEVRDVNIGYILADLMSLYLLTDFIYEKRSSTYQKAKRIIADNSARITDKW